MPYTIRTKDGIEIPNVPDNVDKNSPQARALVQAERAKRASAASPAALPVAPPVNKPEESGLARGLGLVGRAVAPYAAAAGAGAAVGAPFAGVGAIPGAVAGIGAYGLSQLADALVMGGRGQQTVERGLTAAGFPEPQSALENVGVAGIRGMLGAGATAATAANAAKGMELARVMRNAPASTTQRVTQVLGTRPNIQAVAGGTGAAAAQGASEIGLPEPFPTLVGIGAGALPSASVGGVQRTIARTQQGVQQGAQQAASRVRQVLPGTQPTAPSRAVPTPPNKVREGNVSRLEREGIPVSPGQRSGAPLTQTMESVMKYLPASMGQSAKFTDLQQRAYTRALLKRAGIDSDTATQETFRAGQQRFNQAYSDLEANTVLMGGSAKLKNDLDNIANEYGKGFSKQMNRTFKSMRDDLMNWANGTPKQGQTFQRMQEELSAEISRAARSDAPGSERYKQALVGLRGALFDLMEQNTPPAIAKEWRRVNREYAIFKTLEESMLDPSQVTINTAFINPRVVARVEKTQMPESWTRGDPDVDSFSNLVKAGAGIIPDPVPNSGTAQRMFAQDLLTGGRGMFTHPSGPLAGAAQGLSGLGAQAAASAAEPVLGIAVPNLTSRFWYRQPDTSVMRSVPAATEATRQRQKTRRQKIADALQRSK